MALSFLRIQAGEYQINYNHKMVGYVIKKSQSKWTLYKCSNASSLGNPISVKKSLKEIKLDAGCMIPITPHVEENDEEECPKQPDKFELMREMLKRDYVIKLNEYRLTEDGLEDVNEPLRESIYPEEQTALSETLFPTKHNETHQV
jgi:hypothetical protein